MPQRIVPFVNFKAEFKALASNLTKVFLDVGGAGTWILGEKVNLLEKTLQATLQVKNVITCASGTDAITLALLSLGIGKGDEVIIPANSYPSVFGVVRSGAKPILADVSRTTANLDPEKLKKLITNKTKAILLVHLYGQPADIEAVLLAIQGRPIFLIEDCAQAFGAKYRGKSVGTYGKAGVLSFYPTKNLGALGDGGAVITNDAQIAKRIKMLRMYGEVIRYQSEAPGLNSRLDEIQAAFLLAKIPYLKNWQEKREKLVEIYFDQLKSIKEIELPELLPNQTHAFHLFVIRTKQRNKLQNWLKNNGIDALVHYPYPIHHTKSFSNLGFPGQFPEAEMWSKEALSLPLHPFLLQRDVKYVAKNVRRFFS